MAIIVKASLGTTKYFTEIIAGKNTIISDEPIENGGGNKGFNPYELLASSLASCTAATLRMYIDRKKWEVPQINIEVILENNPSAKKANFKRVITYDNANLNEEQFERLQQIAELCPVHKILTNTIAIDTQFDKSL